jgi:hypothetical protein
MGELMANWKLTGSIVAGILILGGTTTACNGNDTATSGKTQTPTAATTTPASSTTPTEPLTAEQVVKALTTTITTAKPATVYTAATDPNKLLGRPGGYTSKADWTDRRAKPNLDDEVQLGGSVEVYKDPAAAKKRGEYIAKILDGMPAFGTEYHYLNGGILLRVSGALTPEQAAEYEAALNKLP